MPPQRSAKPVRPLALGRGAGSASRRGLCRFRTRDLDDRFHMYPLPPARCDGQGGELEIPAWDVPEAASRAKFMPLSMLRVVRSHCARPVSRSTTARKPKPYSLPCPGAQRCSSTRAATATPSVRQLPAGMSWPTLLALGRKAALCFFGLDLPPAQLDRTFLQPHQALRRHRYHTRQVLRKLPRGHQTHMCSHLARRLMGLRPDDLLEFSIALSDPTKQG